jgi:hypothetical protein
MELIYATTHSSLIDIFVYDITNNFLVAITVYWMKPFCIGRIAKLRKVTLSFVTSVLSPAWKKFTLAGGVFMKFDIWRSFENISRKFKFLSSLVRIIGTLHEDLFVIISSWIFLRKRSVSDKFVEKTTTHFMIINFFFFENPAVYEIKGQNMVQPDRP